MTTQIEGDHAELVGKLRVLDLPQPGEMRLVEAVDEQNLRPAWIAPFLDGEVQSVSGRYCRCLHPYLPVEPKPPAPRSVLSSSSASRTVTRTMSATTNWAMRMPRVTSNGAPPWLMSSTETSPR